MAQGDLEAFDQFLVDVQEAEHNLETGTFKLGLITSTTTPAATTAIPHFGGTGTTNLATNQVTAGGNYASGGPTLANPSVTLTGGAGVFDGNDISITQASGNPTNARWGILYDDNTAKHAIHFLDLGSVTDLTSGDFSVTWNASGIHTLNQAA